MKISGQQYSMMYGPTVGDKLDWLIQILSSK